MKSASAIIKAAKDNWRNVEQLAMEGKSLETVRQQGGTAMFEWLPYAHLSCLLPFKLLTPICFSYSYLKLIGLPCLAAPRHSGR